MCIYILYISFILQKQSKIILLCYRRITYLCNITQVFMGVRMSFVSWQSMVFKFWLNRGLLVLFKHCLHKYLMFTLVNTTSPYIKKVSQGVNHTDLLNWCKCKLETFTFTFFFSSIILFHLKSILCKLMNKFHFN